jgi:hypothetical protein
MQAPLDSLIFLLLGGIFAEVGDLIRAYLL